MQNATSGFANIRNKFNKNNSEKAEALKEAKTELKTYVYHPLSEGRCCIINSKQVNEP